MCSKKSFDFRFFHVIPKTVNSTKIVEYGGDYTSNKSLKYARPSFSNSAGEPIREKSCNCIFGADASKPRSYNPKKELQADHVLTTDK